MGSILQEEKTTLNMYAPNNSVSKYETKTDSIVRKKKHNRLSHYYSWGLQHPSISNWQLQYVEKSESQETDINKILEATPTEYTFFSSLYGTFIKTDHPLDCKNTLTNLKD